MGTTGNSPPHPTFFIAASFQQASWGLKIRTDEKATKTNTKYLRACARLNAQSLRYEAVLEIHPRQYSMVWMAWFIKTSAKLNWKTKTHLYPFKQCSAKWNKNIHLPILVYKKKIHHRVIRWFHIKGKKKLMFKIHYREKQQQPVYWSS